MSKIQQLKKEFNKERFRFRVDALCTAACAGTLYFMSQIGAEPETIVLMTLLPGISAVATATQHGNMTEAKARLDHEIG